MHSILKTLTVLIVALLLASPALALNLDEAKSLGLVGEKFNGYVGVVKRSAGVDSLVSSINAQRKAHYQEISKKNGTSLGNVEKLAGQKLINRTPSGQYIDSGSGWVRK